MACDLTKGRKIPCKDVVGGIVRAWFVDFGDLGVVTKTEDAKIDQFNIDNIATTGKINASILKTAAKDAVTTSRIDAGVKLGEAAYSYKKLYG